LVVAAALLWHCRGAHGATSIAAEPKDTREGENVTLTCRFPPEPSVQNLTAYWLRTNKRKPDNVAINGIPLDNNYRYVANNLITSAWKNYLWNPER